jgi:hypothetical protein
MRVRFSKSYNTGDDQFRLFRYKGMGQVAQIFNHVTAQNPCFQYSVLFTVHCTIEYNGTVYESQEQTLRR